MTFLPPVSPFFRPVQSLTFGQTLTPLQHVIVNRTASGTMRQPGVGHLEVTAPLVALSDGIESAFVLIPREALPKVTHTTKTLSKRMFTFAGDPYVPYSTNPGHTAEQARKTAAKWLAIAGHLEGEEKAAADEAKKKADAEAAALNARNKRLSELAYEYFDTAVEELGTRKTRVIEELYRLEEEAAAAKECCGCDD